MDLYFALYENSVYETNGYTSCLYDKPERARKQAAILVDKMMKQFGKVVEVKGIYVMNTNTMKVNKVSSV